MPHNIVRGAPTDSEKIALARHFRQNMTVAERTLWKSLRGNALGGLHFRRQQVINGFIVDFYCHAASLVIEVDGGVHTTSAEYERARTDALSKQGLRIFRLKNDEVLGDLDGTLARIAAAVGISSPLTPSRI